MRRVFIVIVALLVALTGCKDNIINENINSSGGSDGTINENQVKQLNNEILILKAELNNKEITIENMNFEKENFREISTLSLEFSRARDSGDIDRLRSLVSDNIDIIETEDGICGKYMVNSHEVEYPLYLYNTETTYKDMLINGYEYDKEKNIYYVFVQEFFINEEKQIVSMDFVDIDFIQINGVWKIDKFAYDI